MNEYSVSDYGIFTDAVGTTKTLNNDLTTNQTKINEVKSKLNNDSVFMGPICDSVLEGFTAVDNNITTMVNNFNKVSNYIESTATAYKNGDANASKMVLNLGSEDGVSTSENPGSYTSSGLTGDSNAEQIYNYLTSHGYSAAGAAGIMGNLRQESNFRADNVQNGMGYEDEDYVRGIKDGSISREEFINDSRGFGIAQWTYSTRKAALYDYLGKDNIDSLEGQLQFLEQEMSNYSGLTDDMKNASSASSAAATFHNVFERSADANTSTREGFAEDVYNEFA